MVTIYRVKGWFKHRSGTQRFTKEIPALSREHVLERIYSDIGSRHKVKRNLIHIETIEELKPEEVEDAKVLRMMKG